MKNDEVGRSMIEMLGVLAIVGMLSVGGMAGYSKAMMKYKYNKLSEEFTLFIQELYHYKNDLVKIRRREKPDGHWYFAKYLEKMNVLPKSWSVNGGYVYDSMGNKISLFIRHSSLFWDKDALSLDYTLSIDNSDTLCLFMFNNIIFNSANWLISVGVYGSNPENASSVSSWFGNNYCKSDDHCLSDMTMSDVLDLCHFVRKIKTIVC